MQSKLDQLNCANIEMINERGLTDIRAYGRHTWNGIGREGVTECNTYCIHMYTCVHMSAIYFDLRTDALHNRNVLAQDYASASRRRQNKIKQTNK